MSKKLFFCLIISSLAIISSCKSGTKKTDSAITKTDSKKKATEWKNIELGTVGLSIDAPFTFKESDLSSQLTPSVKKLVKRMESFVYDRSKESYSINAVEYQPEVNFNMDGAVEGAIREMTLKSGGKVENRTDKKTEIDGNTATITDITLTNRDKDEMVIKMAIINKDSRMFQLMGLYKAGNETAKENISRIIESIKIN